MPQTIGIIQTRGIGDIVIALPIATLFAEQGHTVLWPVDVRYRAFLSAAAPWIEFLPVSTEASLDEYYFLEPLRLLQARGCDRIHSLYSRLSIPGVQAVDEVLAQSLTFDQYKYAVTGVPFLRKWELRLERDAAREAALHDSLNIEGDYICVHGEGRDNGFDFALPEAWGRDYRIVTVDDRTDSPLDWLYTLEGAARLVLVDSCFSNLVEQLRLPNEKYLLLRSTADFTPVMLGHWHHLTIKSGPPPGPVSAPWAWTVRTQRQP
ncbi:MAG: hypothetical protein U1F52_03075 [Burkholderiales bacterium]